MNRVILIGRLTRDPELSYTPNTQSAVCRFTIAVDRPRKDGQDQGADFIRITVWSRQAETCDRYLSKGRQVAVQGRIQTGSYKDRNGQTVYTTDVVADRVEFLGSSQEPQQPQSGQQQYQAPTQQYVQPQQPQYNPPQQTFTPQQQTFGQMDLPDSFRPAGDEPW